MSPVPPVRYARAADGGHLAFWSMGEGPAIVSWPGGMITSSALFDEPRCAYMQRQLATFATVVSLDRRGIGHSDPLPPGQVPTLQHQAADLLAVLDVLDLEQAVLWGNTWDAQAVIWLAAHHPDRVAKLILGCTTACPRQQPDHPYGVREDVLAAIERELDDPGAGAGPGDLVALMEPSDPHNPMLAAWLEEGGRASPATARAYTQVTISADVRDELPAITAPTLVLHHTGDRWVPVENGRYLAEHIPGARLVEYDLDSHLVFAGQLDDKIAEVERFVAGADRVHTRRRLLTVLFTDVVGSTERLAATEDRRWAAVLDEVDSIVTRTVARHDGRVCKAMGDGHLALFDRPSDAVAGGLAIIRSLATMGVQVRAGAHIGEVELRGEDVAGMAVHVGARVSGRAGAGELLVTRTLADLLAGSPFRLSDAGVHPLKGVPGTWPLFAVSGTSR